MQTRWEVGRERASHLNLTRIWRDPDSPSLTSTFLLSDVTTERGSWAAWFEIEEEGVAGDDVGASFPAHRAVPTMAVVTTFTEPGGHPLNEDAFLVHPHPAVPDCWLCFLADGQGGRAGGSEAARLACRAGLYGAVGMAPERLTDGRTWASLLRQADLAVAADELAGFTTLIGFCITDSAVFGASSGDSAVLMAVGGEAHELTAGQRKNPPVGSGEAEFVSFVDRLSEPWKVLAVTDGVWKYAGWNTMVGVAKTMSREALVEALKDAARLPGSRKFPDDFTVVLFEGTTGWRPTAMPATPG